MTRWRTARTWFMGLSLIGILLLAVSCGGPGGEECGGLEDIASCVLITNITPQGSDGEVSNDVDVTFNPDCDGDVTTNDPEPFTQHVADITFSNSRFPTASEETTLSVTIRRMTITYTLNNCPAGAVCPPLSPFSQNVTLSIPAEGTATATFPFVPLDVKEEYVSQGGSLLAFPSYNANYVFTGQTDFFNDTITVRGSEQFFIGSFNLCTQ